jgi:hypothetical protein
VGGGGAFSILILTLFSIFIYSQKFNEPDPYQIILVRIWKDLNLHQEICIRSSIPYSNKFGEFFLSRQRNKLFWIRIQWGPCPWIRIWIRNPDLWIQEGKNDLQK